MSTKRIGDMQDEQWPPTKPWYQAGIKSLVLLDVMWSVEGLLILAFVKWMIHGSAKIYLAVIPFVLFGLFSLFCADWMNRLAGKIAGPSDRFDKWNPPGFP